MDKPCAFNWVQNSAHDRIIWVPWIGRFLPFSLCYCIGVPADVDMSLVLLVMKIIMISLLQSSSYTCPHHGFMRYNLEYGALGADLEVHETLHGFTPLIISARRGHTTVVCALLRAGQSGFLPHSLVMLLVHEKGGVHLYVRLAWKSDLCTSSPMCWKHVVLDLTAGFLSITEVCWIWIGADVNGESDEGVTALMKASFKGHVETVNLLIETGWFEEQEGETFQASQPHASVLICTAHSTYQDPRCLECVRLVCSGFILFCVKGAHINAATPIGWSSLIFAASRGETDVISALIAAGGYSNRECTFSRWFNADSCISFLIGKMPTAHSTVCSII